MAKIDFLKAKMLEHQKLPDNFFDLLSGPPVKVFFNQQEIAYIKHIITHNRNDIKLKMLNAIMKSKGFSRLSAGTNRIVYRYLDDPNFVLKVAIDRVGMQDSLAEMRNQQWLKPYVCKIFDVTPDGLMSTIERVIPITSKEEFTALQKEIFYVLVTKIIGRTVAEDVGKAFFRNWGTRAGFGIVLLDYPYIYPINETKLFCTHINPQTGMRCTGMIDYDDGFNRLYCRKCGTRYLARDLEDKNGYNDIITSIGGKYPMKIRVIKSDGTVVEPIKSSTIIQSSPRFKSKNRELVVQVTRNGVPVNMNEEPKDEVKEETPVVESKDIEETAPVKEEVEVKEEVVQEKDEITPLEMPLGEPELENMNPNQVEKTEDVAQVVEAKEENEVILDSAPNGDVVDKPKTATKSKSKSSTKKTSSTKSTAKTKSKFIPSPETSDLKE